jgi:YD repeat-containing protein
MENFFNDAAVYHLIVKFVWRPLKQLTNSVAAVRLLAIFLIFALLMPAFLFNSSWLTAARTKTPPGQIAPQSALPQPFVLASTDSSSNYIASYAASINDFFSIPRLPEGFENAKPVSPFRSWLFLIGSSLGVFAPSLPVANAPSNPMPGQFSVGKDFDFDNDGKADIARWHPATTEWQIKNSSSGAITNHVIGSVSSIIAPGDFDGDSKTDVAVFNAGAWSIKQSSNGNIVNLSFGTVGDKPVVGDYNGDGRSDCAVFRSSTNTWWILYSSGGVCNGGYSSTIFGTAGDITAQGKYDNDGATDIAVFRSLTGDWHVQGSSAGYSAFHWGIASDIPAPADYDGDGRTDYAVYRGSAGTWYVSKSSTNNAAYIIQIWGNYGDQPAPSDTDGDNKADFVIWRPTTGVWHIIKSSNSTYDYQTMGMAGDTAVSSAYLKQIGGQVFGYDFAKMRLSPKNAAGGTNFYSRNFNWEAGLVGLQGRASLNAGFGISYNSLVWLKDATNNTIVFNADNDNISPGFRFGFPTVEPIYYDTQTGKYAYLMTTSSGAKVEFKQTAASDTYETADSSYTQLKTVGATNPNNPVENITLVVSGTDGTKTTYEWKAGAFRCSQIKDKNGNYITVSHDAQGLLRTITDTLGRAITVNYNSELYPTSISQTWKDNNGAGSGVTHTWASFSYTTTTISTNFSGLTIAGPTNGTTLKVLQKVSFPDGSYITFEYNGYGQVKKVNNYAPDGHILSYVKTNLENPAANQTDCPRFTETRNWTENFNQNTQGVAQEIVVTNSLVENQNYNLPDGHMGTATLMQVSMQNDPYNRISKTYVGNSGWMEALPIATEDWATENGSSTRKRWSWNAWTQDNVSLSYILNPRVIESKIGDTANTKRTTTEYYPVSQGSPVALYGLVKKVEIYDTNQSTVLKRIENEYNLGSAYTSKRIIGLPSKIEVSGLNQTNNIFEQVSKVTYQYDEEGFGQELNQGVTPIQHDTSNFSSAFVTGRGNLTSVTRWNVEYPNNSSQAATSKTRYDVAGSPIASIDAMNRKINISYADSFNDGVNNRNTFAYPTILTDTAENHSEIKYRYDIGANIWAKSPTPSGAGNNRGRETTREYDAAGRILKEKIENYGGAYIKYQYFDNGIQTKVFTTVVDTNGNNTADSADEVESETWADGAGRIRQSKILHPGSTGGWSGTLVEYDILGRVKRSTVPTEINSSWTPTGDDYRLDGQGNVAFLWTSREYDWKGQTTREINSDGTDRLISYSGCGCAGSQTITVQSELVPRNDNPNINARRTQKIYTDIIGRTYKNEVMNWDGTMPYTTTVQIFNGRDQVTKTKQYAGAENSSTYQEITMSYDGHGRMKTRHYPIEDANASTTWVYNADDSVQQVIDARGSATNYSYNSRGLIEQISYDPPANPPPNIVIPDTPNVSFSYDSIGNRTQMTDGTGTHTYTYDELSHLTSESKTFSGLNGTFTIQYSYQLGGTLKSITDPFNSVINYTSDKKGRLTSVSGTPWAQNTSGNYAGNIKYRSFGQIKQIDYNLPNSETSQIKLEYDNRLRISHSETTSPTRPGNYLMKADFIYSADSRLQSKDDLLDNKWDRTMKYDFAGRLTFNQFGMGLGSDGYTYKRVYEQSIGYDSFSMMTTRSGEHWENDIGFTESYTNGRIQNNSHLTYDASGNIVHMDGGADPHTFQNTIFDASGRRTSFFGSTKGRFGNLLNMVTQRKTEIQADGDGRPVIEKEGSQSYHISNPPPAPWTPSVQTYKVWSSVLQNSLTTITASGNKLETKVFAGGTVIARQKRFVENGQNYDNIDWTTTDAVTGTVGVFSYLSNDLDFDTQETEPLGQKIHLQDPANPPQPLNDSSIGNADDPQWQCQIPSELQPYHCQKAALIQESLNGTGIKTVYDPNKKPGDPNFINADDPPKETEEESRDDRLLHETIHSTEKPEDTSYDGTAVLLTSIPNDDGKNDSSEIVEVTLGEPTGKTGGASITVRPTGAPDLPEDTVTIGDSEITRVVPRSPDATEKTTIDNTRKDVEAILGGDNDCAKFFGKDALTAFKAMNFQVGEIYQSSPYSSKDVLNYTIGIQMTLNDVDSKGVVSSDAKKIGYVTTSSAVINANGSFFRKDNYTERTSSGFAVRSMPAFGGFNATTRQSRVLQLLHELGHVIVKPDGTLLLELDGSGQNGLSEENTRKVKEACEKEIKALGK